MLASLSCIRWLRALRPEVAVLCALAAAPNASAQDHEAALFPSKPITLVVAFPAGGSLDGYARTLAGELHKLGSAVVVENVGGAGGVLGAQRVLRASPDGYTLLFGSVNDLVLAPIVSKNAGYKAADFVPLALVNSTAPVLVAGPKFAGSLEQLIESSKRAPRSVTMGTPGNGTFQHLSASLLERSAGIDLLHVPYKGAAPLMTDLLGGQVDVAVVALPAALVHLKAGRLRALGVLREGRDPNAPEIPSVNGQGGIRSIDARLWAGLAAPPGTPAGVTQRLQALLAPALRSPDMRAYNTKTGSETPDPLVEGAAFGRFLASEDAKFRSVAATVKLDD
jgi:tripartite-type tricarboxylate transporter receptor subunit TctC